MTRFSLTRRSLLAALPLSWSPLAHAAATPYVARIFSAGFDGTRHLGGLHIQMDPGWKTYWRVPGEGGIPPSIAATGDNAGAFSFDCPLPHRIVAGDGESIGYKDEVVFPWALTPADVTKPVAAAISAFVGVCESVCIPVPVKASLMLEAKPMGTPDTAFLSQWQARVPQPGSLVTGLSAGEEAGAVHIDVELAATAEDIFVEGNSMHFYAAPLWHKDRRTARLPVHGAKTAGELRGTALRITLATSGGGLEQSVTVR